MKHIVSLNAAVAIVIVALISGAIAAQEPPVQPSPADRGFVRAAAQNDLAEIAAAKLALTRAHRSDVQGFAQELIDQVGAIDKQRRQIAVGAGIELLSVPSASAQSDIATLSKPTDATFQQRYIEVQLNATRNAASLFDTEGAEGTYPALQDFATRTQPTLLAQQHIMTQIAAGTTNGQVPPVPPLGSGYLPPPAPH